MFKPFRFALLLASALYAFGAGAQPAPDQQYQSDQAQDPPSRVARLGYLRGAVSFVPAGENDWVEAQLNRPLITGDKLWTDRDSRAELNIGASAIRIDEQTSFDFLNLDDQTAQIELTQGALNLRVRRVDENQTYEVDTPTLAFVVSRAGSYRISVAPDGQSTTVDVLNGSGDAYGEGGARFRIEGGQSVTFNDSQLRDYYTDSLPAPDAFDRFCQERDNRWDHARSRSYVSEEVIGYEDLDDNGDWSDVPEYGHVWYPTTVAVGWAPYHHGHWGWVGAYGWTWIDDAPWGFAPFHYGRWAYVGNRWGWCPGARDVRPYYAPALVAFVGGGVSVGVSIGGPVGWFPLGPRDVYFPGYHVSQRYFTNVNVSNTTVVNTTVINNYYGNYARGNVNYTQINYANRNIAGAVTAVPATAFVSARPVAQSAIAVNRETFANARVMPMAAIAPTRTSLLATNAQARVAPPATIANRNIVAATRPPPPVASFATRQAILEKNPGQPLTTRQMRALPSAAQNAGAQNAGGAGANRAAVAATRENVKVVTNAGAPVRTQAAPIAARPNTNPGGNAEARRRGMSDANAAANNAAAGNAAGQAGRPAAVGAPVTGPQDRRVVNPNAANAGPSNNAAVENGRGQGRPQNEAGAANRSLNPNTAAGPNAGNANAGGKPADAAAARGQADHLPSSRFANPNAAHVGQGSDSAAHGNAARNERPANLDNRPPPGGNNVRETGNAASSNAARDLNNNAGNTHGNGPAYKPADRSQHSDQGPTDSRGNAPVQNTAARSNGPARAVNQDNGAGNNSAHSNEREYKGPARDAGPQNSQVQHAAEPRSMPLPQQHAAQEHAQRAPPPQQEVQRAPPPQQQVQRAPPPQQQVQHAPPPQQQVQHAPPPQAQRAAPPPKDNKKDKDKKDGGGR